MKRDLKEALSPLDDLPKYDVKPGLSRIEFLLDRLGHPESSFSSIHIGGSNGKGSVLALLSSVLNRNYRVGEFVSPPLFDFSDRIKVGGERIAPASLAEGAAALEGPLEELKGRGNPPSFFEAATALGAWYFDDKGIDIALMEAGLGGRFDATNPVGRPLLSVVTSVALEHRNLLGGTLEEIAGELAGLAKPKVPLVIGPSEALPREVFRAECDEKDCRLIFAGEETDLQLTDFSWDGTSFRVEEAPVGALEGETLEIGLPGTYQEKNLATAMSALGSLEGTEFSVTPEDIANGLEGAEWPGRFQLLDEDPYFLVDGAHNLAATEVLVEELKRYGDLLSENSTTALVFSSLKDKDFQDMLSALDPEVDEIYLTELDHRRATPLETLERGAKQLGLEYELVSQPREAVKIVKRGAKEEDLICVTGSLYLVREVISNGFRG